MFFGSSFVCTLQCTCSATWIFAVLNDPKHKNVANFIWTVLFRFSTDFNDFGCKMKLRVSTLLFSTFLIFHDITSVFSSENNWSTAVDQLFLEILHQIPPKYSICARDTLPHTFLSTCVLDLKVYQFWTESEPASPMRAWLLFLCCILHFVSLVRARLS